ncbi:FinQ [Acinetobacter junii CIP 107470 = MTCC 11364]|uniref:FinQ n=1 Tax=Acinetobacter junii CIP 107470 = MTCC 11364 TaxID=1217666 RepID=S7WV62_ACIJU|nr:hypothetical protein [Acinetobacter junii]ENV52026.1 hypothetical protein F953_00516 [Acinetobacter junii CIP 107470 = MTCC 11364]EPR85847.1 FinQ [Acinetobacter junii CIP 107470 = MTCC 11364]
MANLSTEYSLPLKIVAVRLNHMKSHLPGLLKKIEKRAIDNLKQRKTQNDKDDTQVLLTWDDWIYAALDADHERENAKKENSLMETPNKESVYEKALNNIMGRTSARKPGWASNLRVGEHIPKELLDRLPVTTGELVTLGNWMLTKNIYRFEDIVITEILKSGFDGVIPNYIVNLPDLCVYIQTDNANLKFEGSQIVGVLFSVTELCGDKVLVSTMYLDSGLPRTIVIMLNEDQDVESSLTDFVDQFQQDYDPETMQKDLKARLDIQKKLINLVLWFSQKKPEIIPLIPESNLKPVQFISVKKQKRLFEASKYKPYKIGTETSEKFKKIYADLEIAKAQGKVSGREPHFVV